MGCFSLQQFFESPVCGSLFFGKFQLADVGVVLEKDVRLLLVGGDYTPIVN